MRERETREEANEIESAERHKNEQLPDTANRIARLEREIEVLKDDKGRLRQRLTQLRDEYAEKCNSVRSSITYQVGDALVKAAMSPRGAFALPYRLLRIYRDYRLQGSHRPRLGSTLSQKSEPTLSDSKRATRNRLTRLSSVERRPIEEMRILFIPTNGGGLGHVTRLLAIARRLRNDPRITEMVFLTTSEALSVIRQEGFVAYHHPGQDQVRGRLPQKWWRSSFGGLFDMIVSNHAVNVLVFDGVSAASITPTIAHYESLCKVWIRRMMLKAGKEELFNEKAREFHLQLVPGELGQEGVPQDLEGRIVLPPMVFLDRKELLSREDVIERLGLDPAKKTVFVQLGAGNINDIATQSEIIVETSLQFPEVQVVLAESLISHNRFQSLRNVRIIRDYPLSVYYQGFDVAISAAGYNTVTELSYFGIPSVFIPNLDTGADDQYGRAMITQRAGAGLMLSPLTGSGLKQCLEKLLDDATNAEFRGKCRNLCPVNGSDLAARMLADFVFHGKIGSSDG